MKRIFAVICLLALVLAGCAKEAAPEEEVTTTEATTQQITTEDTTQEALADVNPLAGTWEGVMDKGQYMALLYYLQTGGDQEYAMTWLGYMEKVSFPVPVTMELGADGNYTYTIHDDADGKALETFASTLYNSLVAYYADLNDSTEEQAKDYMSDNGFAYWDINSNIKNFGMDKMHSMPVVTQGVWEENDQGLFLSGWCTIQFKESDGTMQWLSSDDMELSDFLPMSFNKK